MRGLFCGQPHATVRGYEDDGGSSYERVYTQGRDELTVAAILVVAATRMA